MKRLSTILFLAQITLALAQTPQLPPHILAMNELRAMLRGRNTTNFTEIGYVGRRMVVHYGHQVAYQSVWTYWQDLTDDAPCDMAFDANFLDGKCTQVQDLAWLLRNKLQWIKGPDELDMPPTPPPMPAHIAMVRPGIVTIPQLPIPPLEDTAPPAQTIKVITGQCPDPDCECTDVLQPQLFKTDGNVLEVYFQCPKCHQQFVRRLNIP